MKKILITILCLILALEGIYLPCDVYAADTGIALTYSTIHMSNKQVQFTIPNTAISNLTNPSDWPASTTTLTLNQESVSVNVVLSPYSADTDVRYVYLKDGAINRAFESGKMTFQGSFVCDFGHGEVRFTFPESMYLEELGGRWNNYTSIYTYPNSNVFAYNIDGGRSYLLTSNSGVMQVLRDGNKVAVTVGDELTEPGCYEVYRLEDGVKYEQRLVLYQTGDANASGDVDLKDFLHLKKCIKRVISDDVTCYATDFNSDDILDNTDVGIFAYLLLGDDSKSAFVTAKGDTLLHGKMPIAGFDGPSYRADNPDCFVNADIYKKIQELGINTIVFDSNDFSNPHYGEIPKKNLELAEEYGIGVHVLDHHIDHGGVNSGYLTTAAMAKRVGLYSQYHSFLGVHVVDEPYTDSYMSESGGRYLTDYKPGILLFQKYANLSGYVNLYPYDLTVSEENDLIYTDYINEVLSAGAEMISYDKYPITVSKTGKRNTDYAGFYKNLELARRQSAVTGKPFWAYAQAGTIFSGKNYWDTPEKNLLTQAELQWIINASLSFGARGIQYYQLIQSDAAAQNEGNFQDPYDYNRSGLISANGEKNARYFDTAKEMNHYISTIDGVLMHAVQNGILTNDANVKESLGSSDLILTNYRQLRSAQGENALVGCFDYYGKTALLVVNCHLTEAQEMTLEFADVCTAQVTTQDTNTRKVTDKQMHLTLQAGQSALLVLE